MLMPHVILEDQLTVSRLCCFASFHLSILTVNSNQQLFKYTIFLQSIYCHTAGLPETDLSTIKLNQEIIPKPDIIGKYVVLMLQPRRESLIFKAMVLPLSNDTLPLMNLRQKKYFLLCILSELSRFV